MGDNKMEQGEPSSTNVNEQESEATVSEKSENATSDKSEAAAADKFKWKDHPDANEIAINGIKKKESPSQIMQSLNDKGIKPMPTYQQLSNRIMYLKKSLDIQGKMGTENSDKKDSEENKMETDASSK